MNSLILPGIEGGADRVVMLKKHALHIGPYAFNAHDFTESITINHVENELNTTSLLNHLGVDFGGTIVDIGANVGIYSILASKLYPAAKLVSVEPLGDTHAVMRLNFAENGVISTCVQKAVSDTGQPFILSWHPKNPGSASIIHGGPELEIVGATRLPDLLDEAGIGVADLVKLDVEGMEYAILYDLKEQEWRRIRRLSVELHGVLMFPHDINNAMYSTLSSFLWTTAERFDIDIEVRWPNDHVPPKALLPYWNPTTFSLFFRKTA